MDKRTDQWKTDGNCYLCRRQKYCKQTCSANKKSFRKLSSGTIRKLTPEEVEQICLSKEAS